VGSDAVTVKGSGDGKVAAMVVLKADDLAIEEFAASGMAMEEVREVVPRAVGEAEVVMVVVTAVWTGRLTVEVPRAVGEAEVVMVVVTAVWTGRLTVDGVRKILSVDGVRIAGSGLGEDASGWGGERIRKTGDGAISMMLEKSVLWGGGERGDDDAE